MYRPKATSNPAPLNIRCDGRQRHCGVHQGQTSYPSRPRIPSDDQLASFDEQLALNEYWKQIGGTAMLPGTNCAARAFFYVNAIPKYENPNRAIASVFGVIRNVSMPYGLNTPEQLNISSTRWRTVVGHIRTNAQGQVTDFFVVVRPLEVLTVSAKAIDARMHAAGVPPARKISLRLSKTLF
jgi:hypothetical protein